MNGSQSKPSHGRHFTNNHNHDPIESMKTKLTILAAVIGIALAPALFAEEHDHAEHAEHAEKKAGPNGGRIVTSVEPHFEFFVTPERKLKITFLGDDGKAVAAKDQVITAIGGERSKPTRFTFAKEGDSLLSDNTLPDGKMVPLILQVKVTPDAKSVTERFTVNLNDCPGCEYLEYACTCEHGEEGHEGHDHE